jgi:endonuclease/exonuclease/phosphatase family metal-dependent hydrolase
MVKMADLRDLPTARRRALAAAMLTPAVVLLGVWCLRAKPHPGPDAQAYTGCYADPRNAPAESLTVVSYNIQYGEDLEVAAADLRRHPRLREADVYLLQEMDPAGTDSLARALGCNYVYYRASVSPHHDRAFGNAVLSRWPIVSHRLLVLPHDAPLTGQQRIAVAVDLDLGGRRVRVVSVQLSTMVASLADRLDQAAAIADSLATGDRPVIIGGDFNTISTYEETRLRQVLRERGLREARLPAGTTMERRLLGLVPVRLRLDRVFYTGLEPTATGIAAEAQASDHVPIWARLAVPAHDDPERR